MKAAAHASWGSSRSRRRERELEVTMVASTPRSTATICLDGADFYKILHSYVAALKELDDWIRAGTEPVDASRFFGQGHDVARTREGTFTMVFELEGNSLRVPIRGINLYIRGFQNEHGSFEFDFEDPTFIPDKACKVLDIGVNYHDLMDDLLERTLTGVWPLKKAVRALCKYKGGPAAALAPYVGRIAVHTSEAARTRPVHSFICRSIVDPSLSRLSKAKGLTIWIRKYRPLSFELMDNIDRMNSGKAPRPIKTFGLDITLPDLVVGIRVCYKKAYTQGVFAIEAPENKGQKYGSRGIGGGQGLGLHKVQRGLFTTSSSKYSDTVKCIPDADKSYLTPTLSCAMSQRLTIQRKTIQQLVEFPCTVKPKPAMEKGYALTSPSYNVRCAFSQIVQREAFDRANPSYVVNCSLNLMERLSGQKHSMRRSYGVRCVLNQIVQRTSFDSAKSAYGVKYSLSLMERLSGENSRAHVLTTKRRNLRSRADQSIQRTMLGPGRIYEKLTKPGLTTLQQNKWADNRGPYPRSRSSINFLPSNLSSSLPQQNVRWYLYRVFRFLH